MILFTLLIASVLAPPQDRFTIPVGATTIEVQNGNTVDPDARHSYLIRKGPGDPGVAYETSYLVNLRYEPLPRESAVFDPRAGAPVEPGQLFPSAQGDWRLFVVQYYTHPLREYRVQAAGVAVRPVRLLTGNAEIVLTKDDAARRWLQGQVYTDPPGRGFIRAIVPYRPEYRLEPSILTRIKSGELETRAYVVEVLDSGPRMKGDVLTRILGIRGIIERTPPSGNLLRATLTPDQLEELATWPQVISVDFYRRPRGHTSTPSVTSPPPSPLEKVRADGGANALEDDGIHGGGVSVEVQDTGFSPHDKLPNVYVHISAGSFDPSHGTSVAGIVGANTDPGSLARGVLQHCKIVFSSADGVLDRHQHTQWLDTSGYVLQTNSWGYGPGTYSTLSQDLDQIAYDNDVLILHAMGDPSDYQPDVLARAKNVLSIGAVDGTNSDPEKHPPISTQGGILGAKCSGAMPGVHVKPDLCNYYRVRTTIDDGASPATGWGSFVGTSSSAPQVAGFAGLVYKLWNGGAFGNAVAPNSSVSASAPQPTTVRALLVNSAHRYATNQIERNAQGWGRPNLELLHKYASRTFVIDESVELKESEAIKWTGAVIAASDGLRVTLVYDDPPSTSAGGLATLQNDLSLEVVSPSGQTFWGNHGLGDAKESSPGGANDAYNPIENVFLSEVDPQIYGTGDWTVIVRARMAPPAYLPEPPPEGDADAEVAPDPMDESLLSPAVPFALVICGLESPKVVD